MASNFISESVLGTDLTPEDCETLCQIVEKKVLQKGEVLFEPDTVDGNLYILVEGKLEILKVAGPNKTIHINTIKKGSLIGELSFVDGIAHTMRLQAANEATVLILHHDDFETLGTQNPALMFNVMKSILRFSHQLQRKMLYENLEMMRMIQNQGKTQ
ncbi:MAG: cyclic nucleotide-binding domain-containing protein [Piscirickettsiaceae bacterium CG_4_9_14_3_um_filter_43_564]|nr:cyclic nucleotide-binding domain-containing protein [Thiomicrospira sp.]OIP94270.1 MAG: cyclic nucleotide-binding protein [Thiomicrospira sp. CG2_30_44_34]PIQ02786.1 MAG: cyclic nucleotide-binding protein [Piscirickettsiaceae bacterium CG18_big_fil_WC_8_21_14_2_50_44_103]PIU38600.1 MAG: cyclic nucleotide-binding domain-containing protein [Piscirickettsiaceae bacterium CG07_land_8_20_14_0_80_44_28]PIW58456.1 MAG: cyclic nucleotide-binding domain-containing protein [Piscirickettsiaceae bacteri